MNKPELLKAVSEKVGIGKARVEPVLEALWEVIIDTVASKEDVLIYGFGKFEQKTLSSKTGRNPRTGETISLSERSVPKFTPSMYFRNSVKE